MTVMASRPERHARARRDEQAVGARRADGCRREHPPLGDLKPSHDMLRAGIGWLNSSRPTTAGGVREARRRGVGRREREGSERRGGGERDDDGDEGGRKWAACGRANEQLAGGAARFAAFFRRRRAAGAGGCWRAEQRMQRAGKGWRAGGVKGFLAQSPVHPRQRRLTSASGACSRPRDRHGSPSAGPSQTAAHMDPASAAGEACPGSVLFCSSWPRPPAATSSQLPAPGSQLQRAPASASQHRPAPASTSQHPSAPGSSRWKRLVQRMLATAPFLRPAAPMAAVRVVLFELRVLGRSKRCDENFPLD